MNEPKLKLLQEVFYSRNNGYYKSRIIDITFENIVGDETVKYSYLLEGVTAIFGDFREQEYNLDKTFFTDKTDLLKKATQDNINGLLNDIERINGL